jgi:uncharacterized protein (DUF488 family)
VTRVDSVVVRPIRTLGHGTLAADEFAQLAAGSGARVIVDIRRFPGSRRNPQFDRNAMADWLPRYGLEYAWITALGGRRQPGTDSANVALRNAQFRAYADHMASAEFASGIVELRDTITDRAGALMCAESLWWRCHRRLVADHLVLVEGLPVEHVLHDGRVVPHSVTAGARVQDDHVVYDAGSRRMLDGRGE